MMDWDMDWEKVYEWYETFEEFREESYEAFEEKKRKENFRAFGEYYFGSPDSGWHITTTP
jgi:hypothetical protein